jgi:hypothetical protein
MNIPTEFETKENLKRLEENPVLAKDLTNIQFHEVTKLIKKNIDSGSFLIAKMMMSETNNPEIIKMKEYAFIGVHREFLNKLIAIRENQPAIPEPEEDNRHDAYENLSIRDYCRFRTPVEIMTLIHQLGVIEFIEKRIKTINSKKVHELISEITGIKETTVKGNIIRLRKHNDFDISDANISKANGFIGDKKPLPDIKFDKDIV